MEKTKNEHYVPRMYIKRFGYGTKDKPRISVLKKPEGTVLHNQNPENFASQRFFYDTTEDVIRNVLKKILKYFHQLRKVNFIMMNNWRNMRYHVWKGLIKNYLII